MSSGQLWREGARQRGLSDVHHIARRVNAVVQPVVARRAAGIQSFHLGVKGVDFVGDAAAMQGRVQQMNSGIHGGPDPQLSIGNGIEPIQRGIQTPELQDVCLCLHRQPRFPAWLGRRGARCQNCITGPPN